MVHHGQGGGGLGLLGPRPVAGELFASLAPEAAVKVFGGHARDVQGELLVAVPAKDELGSCSNDIC